jgi:hypothetical protein
MPDAVSLMPLFDSFKSLSRSVPFWGRLLLACSCLTVGPALPAQVTGTTGRVTGRVLDDAGLPVRNAAVTLQAVGVRSPLQFTSAPNGGIDGSAIPPGTYRVCARGPQGSLSLDPCIWAERAPEIIVRAGQTTMMPDVVLESGTVLQVRIVDTAKQLSARSAPGMQLAGIWTEKLLFYPLPAETAPDGSTTYKMLVPYERNLTFTAGGGAVAYQIAGKTTTSKQGVNEKIRLARPAGPSQTVTLTVSGAVAP